LNSEQEANEKLQREKTDLNKDKTSNEIRFTKKSYITETWKKWSPCGIFYRKLKTPVYQAKLISALVNFHFVWSFEDSLW